MGKDWLTGGGGADYLDGGEGSDVVFYLTSNEGVTVNLATNEARGGHAEGDTLLGAGFQSLHGSEHDDTLTGNNRTNGLYGHSGDDTLRGGDGDDHLFGGDGADELDGGAGANDVARYGGAAYYDSGSDAGVTVNLATGKGKGGHAEGDTLQRIEHVQGSQYDDVLTGDSGDNQMYGGDGDDTLRGGDGNDTLGGGLGEDDLDGGEGDGDMVSYGGSTVGVTVNLAANTASGGEETMGDTIQGFEGVMGSNHHDALTGNTGNNELQGRHGNDTLRGGGGDDTLVGGPERDKGFGDADHLIGGAGADTLRGGIGADRFAFVAATDSTSGTRDLIEDFESSEGDRIDLSDLTGFGKESTFIAGRAFSNLAGEVRYAQRTESGTAYTDVFGDADGNGVADFVVTLVGTHDLTVSDFFLG